MEFPKENTEKLYFYLLDEGMFIATQVLKRNLSSGIK